MATKNFFDLLGDDENEDPSQVVVRGNSSPLEVKSSSGAVKKPSASSKTPSKLAHPADAVKGSQSGLDDVGKAGQPGGRGGRGIRGSYNDRDGVARDDGGYRERNFNNDRSDVQTRDGDGFVGARNMSVEKSLRSDNGEGRFFEGSRGGGRGRGRVGRGYSEGEERTRRREFDRHSGNSRGNESEKRAGAGRGNWGTDVDSALIVDTVESYKAEEASEVEEGFSKIEQESLNDATVEEGAAEVVPKEEEEDSEMTLEEYEKVLEHKRRVFHAEKVSERKVEVDKAFEKMLLVNNKKREEDVFIKLGHDKEKVKRDAAEREEKVRKPVSINEFLKPVEGEKYYGPPSNRGRGGRGGRAERREVSDRRESGGRIGRESSRGSFGGGRVGGSRGMYGSTSAPKIEDQSQFPTLGAK